MKRHDHPQDLPTGSISQCVSKAVRPALMSIDVEKLRAVDCHCAYDKVFVMEQSDRKIDVFELGNTEKGTRCKRSSTILFEIA